jgi:spermidine/putrescine-binding protein
MRRKGRGAGREISRRELIAGGVSALSALSAFSACRPKDGGAPISGAGPLERDLAIYNWSDYVGEATIADFERGTVTAFTSGTTGSQAPVW